MWSIYKPKVRTLLIKLFIAMGEVLPTTQINKTCVVDGTMGWRCWRKEGFSYINSHPSSQLRHLYSITFHNA